MNHSKGSDTKEEWSFFYKNKREVEIFPINLSRSDELIDYIYHSKFRSVQEESINDVIYKPIADRSAVTIQRFYHDNKSKFNSTNRSTVEATNEKSKFADIFSALIKPEYTRPQLECTYQDYIDKNLEETINMIREEINKQKKEESKELHSSSSPFESSNGKFTGFDESNFSSKEGQPVDEANNIRKNSRGDTSPDGFGNNSDFGNDAGFDDDENPFFERKHSKANENAKEKSDIELKTRSTEKLKEKNTSDVDTKEFDNNGKGGFDDDNEGGFGDDNKGFGDDKEGGFGDDNKGFGDEEKEGFGGFSDDKFNDTATPEQKDVKKNESQETSTKTQGLKDQQIDTLQHDKSKDNITNEPKNSKITRNINLKSNPFGLSSDESDDLENPFGADDDPFHSNGSDSEDDVPLNKVNQGNKSNINDNKSNFKSESSNESFSSHENTRTVDNNSNNTSNISDEPVSKHNVENNNAILNSVRHFEEEEANSSDDDHITMNNNKLPHENQINKKTDVVNKLSEDEDKKFDDNSSDHGFGDNGGGDSFGSDNDENFGGGSFGDDNFGSGGFGSDDEEKFGDSGFGNGFGDN